VTLRSHPSFVAPARVALSRVRGGAFGDARRRVPRSTRCCSACVKWIARRRPWVHSKGWRMVAFLESPWLDAW